MKLSVIIPVFNAETFLPACLDSILLQTFTEFEVWLVNDGSEDNSLQICQSYEKADSRIHTVSKENGGSNSARKYGLSFARGDFVTFIDADDWIDADYLEAYMGNISENNADITTGGIRCEYEIPRDDRPAVLAGIYEGGRLQEEFYPRMFFQDYHGGWGILPSIAGKFYKRELVWESICEVDENIYFAEDVCILFPACIKAERISVINNCGYHYRINMESITYRPNPLVFENNRLLYEHLKKYFMTVVHSDILMEQLELYMFWLTDYAFRTLWNFKNEIGAARYLLEQQRIDRKWSKPMWILDLHQIEKYGKIVLFGAGAVGHAYKHQLDQLPQFTVVAWTDNHAGKADFNDGFIPVQQLISLDFDVILIAVAKEGYAAEIKQQLKAMGIGEDKIVWKAPIKYDNVFYK